MENEDQPSTPLAGLVRRGLGWGLLSTFVLRLGSLASSVVLARVLVPSDYGVFAVALVVLNALTSLNELGASLALVSWPDDPRVLAPTVQTVALVTSATLFLGVLAGAPLIASTMGAPGATPLIRVLASVVLLDACATVPGALLNREFRQKLRLMIDSCGFGVSTTLAIVLAISGAGAWSLVWSQLAGTSVVVALMLVTARHRYPLGFDLEQARRLLPFGLPLAASSLLVFAMLNVDNVVVGAVLGPAALGYYVLAFNLSSWPVNVVSTSIRKVALPAFSQLLDRSDQKRAEEVFVRSIGSVALVSGVLCALLGTYAEPLIHVVYGARWDPSVEVLRWLAVMGAARVLAEITYDYLIAMRRQRATLILQIAWTALASALLVAATRLHGVVGAGMTQALVGMVMVVAYILVALRGSRRRLWQLLRICLPAMAATTATVLSGIGMRALLTDDLFVVLLGGLASLTLATLVSLPARRELTTAFQ